MLQGEHLQNDAEDKSEPSHTSIQPGGGNHGQYDASQTHSVMTCEGFRLKTGQVVAYTDSGSG